MYEKIKFENSLARNMFSRSNMDSSMADMTSEGISKYLSKVQDRVLLAWNMSIVSNIQYSLTDVSSEGINE